jgi:parallel beta-helix repeat protein
VIESGFSWIKGNRIHDNNDGITMFDSSPHVSENIINENCRSGIIVTGCSFPKIEKNSIFGNITSGVIIRDNSSAMIVHNKVIQ